MLPPSASLRSSQAVPADSASALWHGFLDTLSDPLLVLDGAGRIGFANTAALRRWPCEPGTPLARLVPPLPQPLVDWVHAGLAGRVGAGTAAPQAGAALSRLSAERWALRLPVAPAREEPQSPSIAAEAAAEAEHAARERAERALQELDQWFSLSPVGMLAFDDAGLVLRSNAVFEALVGRVPVLLSEAPQGLRALLGWSGPGGLSAAPAGETLERHGWVETPPGDARAPARRRLCARVCRLDAGSAAASGAAPPRYIAVIEDRSAEQALGLAQAQLGALVDTAGVGVALQSVGRELVMPGSLAEFERLQQALRNGERAQARYAIRHPELGTRWLLTRVEARVADGGPQAVVTLDVTEQELGLARNEELLRELTSILESSSAGIAYLRGDTLVRCNRSFERMLGLSAGAVAGASLRELFAGQPRAETVVRQTELSLRESGLFETEVELHRAGREPQWVALSARRIGAAGAPEAVAVLTDITRLKRQQQQLERLADERERTEAVMAQQAGTTRAILDSVFVGIVTVGASGIEWMNRSARRMFAGGLADFQHQPLDCVATLEPAHPFRQPAEQLVAAGSDGAAAGFECRVQARDGRTFWVVGNVVSTGDALGPQWTYALLDIDRRRSAEAATAQAQASLQRVIELAPLAIALFDADTARLRRINPVAAAATGLPASALIGRTPAELPLPIEGAVLHADLQTALADGPDGGLTRREYRFTRKGRERLWDARFLPLAQPGRPPDEVLLVATDITEQRLAETARLEAALAQRDMLVKEVHHRIKNNLQGVAGLLTQSAQRQPQAAPALREAVAQVQAIAQVYGLQVGGHGPLRLVDLLEAIAAGLRRSSGRPIGVAVQGRADEAESWALPEAEAIPIALTLNGLIGNALEHGGGAVDCAMRCEADTVHLEIRNDGALPEGFSLERVGSGVSGLGLVRALLPRRSATLELLPEGDRVLARVSLRPPGLMRVDAGPRAAASAPQPT